MDREESKSFQLAKTFFGKRIQVEFDRPMGTKHPKHGWEYPVNYGFVPGIKAPDGGDLDVYYLGVDEPLTKAEGVCTAIIHRHDDDDDKLVVVPEGTVLTDEEIKSAVEFQEKWFDSIVVRDGSKRVIIVDEDDNEIGVKAWGEMLLSDRYRVSALWVVDSEGKILLARRAHNKVHNPGVWGPAVAGTIEEGETYDSNIVKEAEEELQLKIVKPLKVDKLNRSGKYTHFTQWYKWVYDGQEIVFAKDEVAEVKWWTKEELNQALADKPEDFIEKMRALVELF